MTDDFEENIYRERIPNACDIIKNKTIKCCSVESITNFFPIVKWLPKYQKNFLLQDFVAGLTVGLTTIPQAVAYAVVAGLPTQYGLYSAFMGCFVYIIFGTCKDITVGPTAIMSLMVQTHVAGSPDFAVLMSFLAGVIIFIMGLLNLGVLVQFISIPVTTGFSMAAAITIATGQINNLFGISSSSNEFITSWQTFFTNLDSISVNDTALGVSTLIFLLIMRKLKDFPCNCKIIMKYISLSRNAVAVLIGIAVCYYWSDGEWLPFNVSGKITAGLPKFQLPPFSTEVDGKYLDFKAMITELGASLASIPLIAVLESIAVAKAFSKGKTINASQEMIALGMCNLLGSFVLSMPITGSFTRTAINNASGVKTTLGGAATGILVLMALAFLTETFKYIPKATLAAIIIAAMIFMVEYDQIAKIWRSKKIDFIPFLITVAVCLFWSLEYGIVCGIFTNMIFILYKSARPKIIITKAKINNTVLGLVEVQENLEYSSAEYLKSKVIKFRSIEGDNLRLVVIKGENIHSIDSTVALNLISLRNDLSLLNCEVICWNWNLAEAGVICRIHKSLRSMFKFNKELAEVVNSEIKISVINDDLDSITHISS